MTNHLPKVLRSFSKTKKVKKRPLLLRKARKRKRRKKKNMKKRNMKMQTMKKVRKKARINQKRRVPNRS